MVVIDRSITLMEIENYRLRRGNLLALKGSNTLYACQIGDPITSRWKIGCMDVRSNPMMVREKDASPSLRLSIV